LTQDKAIHLQNKPLIPRDIIESDLSLQSYLEQNIIDNRQDEKTRLRIAKAKQTWTNKKTRSSCKKDKGRTIYGFRIQPEDYGTRYHTAATEDVAM
jgi:hypothetical protein